MAVNVAKAVDIESELDGLFSNDLNEKTQAFSLKDFCHLDCYGKRATYLSIECCEDENVWFFCLNGRKRERHIERVDSENGCNWKLRCNTDLGHRGVSLPRIRVRSPCDGTEEPWQGEMVPFHPTSPKIWGKENSPP